MDQGDPPLIYVQSIENPGCFLYSIFVVLHIVVMCGITSSVCKTQWTYEKGKEGKENISCRSQSKICYVLKLECCDQLFTENQCI